MWSCHFYGTSDRVCAQIWLLTCNLQGNLKPMILAHGFEGQPGVGAHQVFQLLHSLEPHFQFHSVHSEDCASSLSILLPVTLAYVQTIVCEHGFPNIAAYT